MSIVEVTARMIYYWNEIRHLEASCDATYSSII